MYAYDKGPLHAKFVSQKKSPDWIHKTVTYDAAYGNERVTGHLFLPQNARPPYQAVVFVPCISSFNERVFPQEGPPVNIAFLVQSGRAVLWPEYKGMHGRRFPAKRGKSFQRDHYLQVSKDLGRSIDYLAQRADIDLGKLAYFGESWGACLAPLLLAVEDRPKVAVLAHGGLPPSKRPFPEIDQINFAPRVQIPVLMINGRKDSTFPVETSQRPLYEFLGTPAKDKSHRLFDAGHAVPWTIIARETVPWLDKYLGPLKR